MYWYIVMQPFATANHCTASPLPRVILDPGIGSIVADCIAIAAAFTSPALPLQVSGWKGRGGAGTAVVKGHKQAPQGRKVGRLFTLQCQREQAGTAGGERLAGSPHYCPPAPTLSPAAAKAFFR